MSLAAAALVAALPQILPIVQSAEEAVADLRIAYLTPPAAVSEDIVILAINDDTLAALPYRSPVDRAFLAALLRTVEQHGAAVIGLDILLDQPTEPEKDALLRDTLATLGVPVVAAWADERLGVDQERRAYLADMLGTAGHGYAGLTKDAIDGTVRRHRPRVGAGGTPSFPAALAAALGRDIPDATFRIDYRGRPNVETPAFPAFPAHVAAALPPDWFAGKIVLIGADLAHVDRHRTPLSARRGAGEMAGVVAHAHILSQILESRAQPRPTPALAWLFAFVVGVLGLGLALVPRLPILVKAALGLALLAGLWIGCFYLFSQGGPLMPLLAPSLAFMATGSVAAAYAGRQHRARRQLIRRAFQHFLAPEMVKRLEANPDQLKAGGERREMTFLFTDMAGFTTFSESLEPTVLVSLLNDYLDGMSRIVLRHHGTIDKFVGDAVVAFFGAPGQRSDHASLAVVCAMNMDAFVQGFIQQWAERGVTLGITRIGVHTGEATVGNFGGSERFDYTAMGDTVNTAARLESVNKHLGTRICVSGACAERCPNIALRPVGDLVLKGKRHAVSAFEPLRRGAEGSPATKAYLDAFEKLKAGDPAARAAFADLAEMSPDDPLARLHLERLEAGERGIRIELTEK